MARRNCGRADRGSRYHLQNLVTDNSALLTKAILSKSPSLPTYHATQPRWASPLDHQEYREYRDGEFLRVVGLSHMRTSLSEFWPRPGPYWDGLATVPGKKGGHGVLLVEAKSHIREVGNRPYACRAGGKGLERIKASLAVVKRFVGVHEDINWLGEHYQYANRLAHLFWLNAEGVPVWMVFLYFIGDLEQAGPDTELEWRQKLNEMKLKMGLPEHHVLSDRIIEVFLPVPRESIPDNM